MGSYDVVIMGGGLAGNFLARQLKIAKPELSVLVLEASEMIDNYKVGESTVEVAANYMVRKLNLGTYLYQHQLPKNGLRFFFDSEKKDLPLTEMSEIGSDHMPYHPSFQLNRATLEQDLVKMNRELDIRIELGAKVVDFTIDGSARHSVTYEQHGEKHTVDARWLVDATGRRHLIQRKLGNKVHKETRLNTGAAWARYENLEGMDKVIDPAWRNRVRYTSRYLSTNHMMYDGYWLWFIPLAGDVMSVGAVYDKDRIGAGPRTAAQFEQFMKSHRSSRDLMEGAKLMDFQSYAHLPYYSDVYFSRDRWGLVGEAGAFQDPFYSPGSDFISTSNEFVTSLIMAETAGDTPGFHERVDVFNEYYKYRYENVIRLYIGAYPIFGSYEVFRLKYLLDFNNYYNLVVWPFMQDKFTDVAWLKEELKISKRILEAISTSMGHLGQLGKHLYAKGEYFKQNTGRYSNGLCGVAHLQNRITQPVDADFRRKEVDAAFASVFASVMERMMDKPGISNKEALLKELGVPQVMLFKDVNDESFRRVMDRVATRIERDLKREFPQAAIERVLLDKGDEIKIVGPAPTDPAMDQLVARARELWNMEGSSLTHVTM